MARARQRVHPETGERSMTHQSFKESVDVNLILKNYQRTGQMPLFKGPVPVFGDFSMSTDLHGALEAVSEAEEHFASLAATVRDAAGNDPVRFLEMLASEEGLAELSEAGFKVFDPDELVDEPAKMEVKVAEEVKDSPEEPAESK